MKTAVMTDTNSGITLEEGKANGIFVLPMPVMIDGKDYMEEVTLDHPMLYKALNEEKDIVSSQPSQATSRRCGRTYSRRATTSSYTSR